MKISKMLLVAVGILLIGSASAQAGVYLHGNVYAGEDPYTNTSGWVSLSCNATSDSATAGAITAYDYAYIQVQDDGEGNLTGIYEMDSDNDQYSPCGESYTGVEFSYCSVNAYPGWQDTNIGSSPSYPIELDCVSEGGVTQDIEFSVSDKTINVTVTAGGEAVTEGITTSCSQRVSPWFSSYVTEPTEGVYVHTVPSGTFYCSGSCTNYSNCLYSGYPQESVTVDDENPEANVELNFGIKNKMILVSATAGGEPLTSNLQVSASEQGGSWSYSYTSEVNEDGKYELPISSGIYNVYGSCNAGDGCDFAGYPSAYVTVKEGDETVEVSLDFTPCNATISGSVTDGTDGLSNVYVNIYSYTNAIYVYAITDENGAFQRMVPAGTYTVSAYPPWDRSDLGSGSTEVNAAASATTVMTLALPIKGAVIQGTVTSGGVGVPAYINGWSWSDQTGAGDWFGVQADAEGNYTAHAIEGLTYNVTSFYYPDVANSSVCGYTEDGMQTVVASSTPQTVDFTYPVCTCRVTINTTDVTNEIISSINGGVSISPKTASDYWYTMWTNINAGIGDVKVVPGLEYTFTPYIWDENYVQGDSVDGICDPQENLTIYITMYELDATISGSYVDENNDPVTTDNYTYINVYATKGNDYRNCEASSDGFSCQVSAGEWCLGYWVDPSSGFASLPSGIATNCFTIASGETATPNLTFLRTGTINVTAKNSDGEPRPGSWVEATPFSNSDEGETDSDRTAFESSGCTTDENGECSIYVGAVSEGTIYYINSYLPYSIKEEESILNAEEVSVTVLPGETVTATLTFKQPDGTSVITVVEGSASPMITVGKDFRKAVMADVAVSPIEGATVDCFSVGGATFETQTDASGVATCPCIIADTWRAVAYKLMANSLYLSEAEAITCTEEGGVGALTIENVATVPEGKSVTIDDVSSQPLMIALSDGFSVSFPIGSLGEEGSATCSVDIAIPPFTSNRRPASFYGYEVSCKDGEGSSIVQLNSDATFTMPLNATQLENLGLDLNAVSAIYYDTASGTYKLTDGGATVDATNYLVKYQQNHLTLFGIVGNGNLKGITGGDDDDGEDNGDDGDNGEKGNGGDDGDDGGGGGTPIHQQMGGGWGCHLNAYGNMPGAALTLAFLVTIVGFIYGLRFVKVRIKK